MTFGNKTCLTYYDVTKKSQLFLKTFLEVDARNLKNNLKHFLNSNYKVFASIFIAAQVSINLLLLIIIFVKFVNDI